MVHLFYRTDKVCIIIQETSEEGEEVRRSRQLSTFAIIIMIMSLQDTYNSFKVQHSTIKMSLLKFRELRPPNVNCLNTYLIKYAFAAKYHEKVWLFLVTLGDHL